MQATYVNGYIKSKKGKSDIKFYSLVYLTQYI